MGYWISYLGRRLRRRPAPVLRGRRRAAVRAAGRARGAARARAGARRRSRWTRRYRYAPFSLVLVLVGLHRDDGGLPGGHAAAPRVELHVQPLHPGAVPAHHLQGGAARRARASRCWPGCAATRSASRRSFVALALVACWPLDPRPRALDDQLLWERVPSAWTGRGRSRRRARRGRPRGRASRPAVRLLRLGRDDRPDPARAGRHAGRRAQRRRLRRPARHRPAVDARRARPAAARAARPARPAARPDGRAAWWSPAPTTTAPAAAPPPPPRPPTCSTSSGEPSVSVRRGARAPARGGHARGSRARCPRCAPGTARRAPGLVRVEPEQPGGDRRRLRRGPRRAGRVQARDWANRRAGGAPRRPGGMPAPDGRGWGLGVRRGRSRVRGRRQPGADRGGDEVVITDSNRRRVLVPSRLAQNAGPTLSAAEEPSVGRGGAQPVRRARPGRADGRGLRRDRGA